MIMKKFIFAGLGAMCALGLALPASAANWVIDFDTAPDGSAFASNTIFGDGDGTGFQRFEAGIFGASGIRVTISVESDFNSLGEINLAVGYDSTLYTDPILGITNTRDPDLVEEFLTPLDSSAPSGYRNILIIQSSEDADTRSCATLPSTGVCDPISVASSGGGSSSDDSSDSNGVGGAGNSSDSNGAVSGNSSDSNDTTLVHRADDEGAGGRLIFDFDTAVDLVGLNVFDIEDTQPGSVTFLDASGNEIGVLTMPTTNDNGVAFMEFGEIAQGVARMTVEFNGSGAIDNITGQASATIPEPGTLALFGVGLIGLTALRRRRKISG